METPKNKPKGPPAKPAPAAKPVLPATAAPVAPAARVRVPPLFRKIDWLTMLIAFGVVWFVYYLTLAPEVTLEDSGELCTGAFYAGIPHPPGYPFWSLYAWFWTAVLPIGNVAWRVEMGESFGAAMACGLVGLMISRGSSMLLEGIEEFKGLAAKAESAICMVSGAVAGIMLGLGGVMWSESVAINRISLFGVPWMMLVMAFLLRWIYAPRQIRYLFFAMLAFGICSTIHQTLLCAGVGIEVAIAATNPRLGRQFFLWNSFMFIGGLIVFYAKATTALDVAQELLNIFAAIGVLSIAAYLAFAIFTRITFNELCMDACLSAAFMLLVGGVVYHKSPLILLALLALGGFVYFAVVTWKLGHEWLPVFISGVLVIIGVLFYFWEPIAGMTNPPMEWGYPRTVEGFKHAITRGQYDKAHPTDVFHAPLYFVMQLGLLVSGIAEEYNWLVLVLALIPLFYFLKMQKRERAWIIGVTGIYVCVGVLLVILMNPGNDKMSVDLHKVFFTTSHGVVAVLVGYGLALTAALMVVNYEKFRALALYFGAAALLPAFISLYSSLSSTYFAGANLENYNHRFGLFLLLAAAFVLAGLGGKSLLRLRDPQAVAGSDPGLAAAMFFGVAFLCLAGAAYYALFDANSLGLRAVLATIPQALSPKLANLPALAGLLIMGIAVAFLAGVMLLQKRPPLAAVLGLFALFPVASAMSHWGTCEERNHWFGYWFGHDMFTPPFTAPDGSLSYDAKLREQAMKAPGGNLVYPEMTPGAILFGGTDPGRFCPTYMIFCESFIPHRDQPIQDQHFDRRDVYIITQNALADDTYMDYIRAQYDRSQQKDPPFFQELLRGEDEQKLNYTTNLLARVAYQFLDRPLTAIGANIEARRRRDGVYPAQEIYIPDNDDMQRSYAEYMADAQQRYIHDTDPAKRNEQRQMRQGEIPVPMGDGRISISGQASVMAINGLLTKIIFDRNPTNDYYVEESFPLDWMFPHLSPYGVIMKINHQPLSEVTDEMVKRDHKFWSDYSSRLTGNWLNYDTSVKEIADFVDKVYIQHDYTGFTGNRRYVRDEQAQKSFSKLRTAIAGIYAWRVGELVGTPTPPEYLATGEARARMIKEADFAYRQAFVYCPFSPEVTYRYVQFLIYIEGRYEDAHTVAATCLKFDPNNEELKRMERELNPNPPATPTSSANPAANPGLAALQKLEKQVQDQPTNYPAVLTLAQTYIQMNQPSRALGLLDRVIAATNTDVNIMVAVGKMCDGLHDVPRLELVLKRLVQIEPNDPLEAYQLAEIQVVLQKTNDALSNLRRALQLSDAQLAQSTNAMNLRAKALGDPIFATISNLPDYQQVVRPPK